MKKFILGALAILAIVLLSGCEVESGEYKEGTYFGSAYDSSYDAYATAVVYVDDKGMIKSVFLDTAYINEKKSETTVSTKKVEGDDYNMKKFNAAAAGEWYEQVGAVEKYVVEHQGWDVTLNESGKTDAISGATINLAPIEEALLNALNQAK